MKYTCDLDCLVRVMYEKGKLFKYILNFARHILDEQPLQGQPDQEATRRARKKRRLKGNPNGGPSNNGGPKRGKNVDEVEKPVLPVAPVATMKPRHYGVLISFFLVVVIPAVIVFWYMETKAADQYASTVGFTVRKEEAAIPTDFLGGLTGFGSSSSSDTDILYEFIQSQQLVSNIDEKLDLRALYSAPQNDIVFSFDPNAPLEKLVDYWSRMVKIYYDAGTGLIELRVLAFTPKDAQNIAQEIFTQSSEMINELSDIARADTTRYARAELDNAVEKLKVARQAVTEFRNNNMIVDPSADIQGQMGLLNTLQQQLAEAMIDLDLLADVTREDDPRIEQAKRKILVIEGRIAEERQKFGLGEANNEEAYSVLIGQYEVLTVEREFAERTYFAALATYDSAVSEASHQSRYLAAYVKPTLAESSQYPKRLTLFGLSTMFILMLWSISVLVVYSIRDHR